MAFSVLKKTLSFYLVVTLLLGSFAYAAYSAYAESGTPDTISYQGRLTDSGGNALGGSGAAYYFRFSLWDSPNVGEGNKLWPTNSPSSVPLTVRNGIFNVDIGDTTHGYPDTLDYDFRNNKNVYLQVEISADNSTFETLSPRSPLTSSPYAKVSSEVSGLGQSSFGTTNPIVNSVVTVQSSDSLNSALSIIGTAGQSTYSTGSLFDLYKSGYGSNSIGATFRDDVQPTYAANADNLLTVRGTGDSSQTWRGRITAGGDNVAFIMGEYNSQAWLGAHVSTMDAWAPLYINPDGGENLYLGNVNGQGAAAAPIITVQNSMGYVGIGTSNPTQELQVLGSLLVGDGTDGSGLKIRGTDGSTLRTFDVTNTGNVNSINFGAVGGGGDLRAHGQNFLLVTTSGTEYARFVSSTGRFGIGTTTPSARIAITGPDTTTGRAFVVANSLNAEKFTILDNGNVGVGTSNPSMPLQVNGNVTFGTTPASSYYTVAPLNLSNNASNALKTQLNLINGGGGGGAGSAIDFYTYTDQPASSGPGARFGAIDDGSYSGSFIFSTKVPGAAGNAITERLRIASNGNVGIGTTTPQMKLDVAGAQILQPQSLTVTDGSAPNAATIWDISSNPTAGAGWYFLMNNRNTVRSILTYTNYNTLAFGQNSGYFKTVSFDVGGTAGSSINFNASGSTIGKFTSSGLGLGTSTPSAKLDIYGTAGSSDIFAISSSTNARLVTVAASGNVGIGNSNPGYKLDVSGTLGVSGDAGGSIAIYGGGIWPTLSRNGGTGGLNFNTNASMVSGVGYSFQNNGTSLVSIMNTGSVGIGTASPVSLLDFGNLTSGSEIINLYTGSAGGRIGFGLKSSNPQFYMPSSNNFTWNSGGDLQNTGTNELMRLTGTGNLGIGITSPSARLHSVATTEQLRLGYDASNYTKFIVGSASGLTMTPAADSGNAFLFTKADGTTPLIKLDSSGPSFQPWVPTTIVNAGASASTSIMLTVNGGSNAAAVNINSTLINPTGNHRVNNFTTTLDNQSGATWSASNYEMESVLAIKPRAASISAGQVNMSSRTQIYGFTGNSVAPVVGTQSILQMNDSLSSINNFTAYLAGVYGGLQGTVGGYTGYSMSDLGSTISMSSRYGVSIGDPAANNYFAGKVGIGTSNPAGLLDVYQSGGASGVVTVTAGGTTVTGLNTKFNDSFKVGGIITANGETHTITAISSDTSMTTDAWTNAATNVGYTVVGYGSRFTVKGNGNIGVGTNAPAYLLDVNGNMHMPNTLFESFTGTTTKDGFSVDNAGGVAIKSQSGSVRGSVVFADPASNSNSIFGVAYSYDSGATFTPEFTIMPGGNVGIGTTTPTAQLSTTGTVRFSNFGAGTLQTDASGNLTVSSDERLKDIQGSFTRGLVDIEKISPITFKWNKISGYDRNSTYSGFSAQNVQLAIPEAVATSSSGYLSLTDRPILAAVVNAVKELDAKIEGLASSVVGWIKYQNDQMCVDDVCVTKEEFKQMLLNAKNSSSASQSSTTSSSSSTEATSTTSTTTSQTTVSSDTTTTSTTSDTQSTSSDVTSSTSNTSTTDTQPAPTQTPTTDTTVTQTLDTTPTTSSDTTAAPSVSTDTTSMPTN